MATPFVGEIRIFSGRFAPDGWMYCNGQSLNISQYQVLYAVIGTIYGGSPQSGVFNLPNLQTYAPMGTGTGTGLTPRNLAVKTGSSTVTISQTQIPEHTHTVQCTNQKATSEDPTNRIWAKPSDPVNLYSTLNNNPVHLGPAALGPAGSANPSAHSNMQPYLGISFIIAYQGDFPMKPS